MNDKGTTFLSSKKISFKAIFIPLVLILIAVILIIFDSITNKSASNDYLDDTEARLCSMINDLDGVSNADVMLLSDADGKISGAAVICIGGNEAYNQKNITDLITSLFDIRSCDVFVGGK